MYNRRCTKQEKYNFFTQFVSLFIIKFLPTAKINVCSKLVMIFISFDKTIIKRSTESLGPWRLFIPLPERATPDWLTACQAFETKEILWPLLPLCIQMGVSCPTAHKLPFPTDRQWECSRTSYLCKRFTLQNSIVY